MRLNKKAHGLHPIYYKRKVYSIDFFVIGRDFLNDAKFNIESFSVIFLQYLNVLLFWKFILFFEKNSFLGVVCSKIAIFFVHIA